MRVDLPALGKPNKADIRDQLELQLHLFCLAEGPFGTNVGGLVGRGFKAVVAPPAPAALAQGPLFLVLGKVMEDFLGLGVFDEGAAGNFEDQVLAGGALSQVPAAGLPAIGLDEGPDSDNLAGRGLDFGLQDNGAAPSPFPPAGPPLGMNFSLRQETMPLPPRPAVSVRVTVSTNINL